MSDVIFCRAASREINRRDCYHSKKDPDCQSCKNLKEITESSAHITSNPKDHREKKETTPDPKTPAQVSKNSKPSPVESKRNQTTTSGSGMEEKRIEKNPLNRSEPDRPHVTEEAVQMLIDWVLPEDLKISVAEGMRAASGKKLLKQKTKMAVEYIFWSAFVHFIDPSGLVRKVLTELRNKGVNILKIAKAIWNISFKWQQKAGAVNMTVNLSTVKPKIEERVIRNAFGPFERLNPVFPETPRGQGINLKLAEMQTALRRFKLDLQNYLDLKLLELYLPYLQENLTLKPPGGLGTPISDYIFLLFPPERIRNMHRKKLKPPSQSTQNQWGECIVEIVHELKRVGYSNRQSFIETGKLLNLSFPEIYTDRDPDRVRQIYAYHTKTRKSPITRNKTPEK